MATMTDRDRGAHQLQVHSQQQRYGGGGGIKTLMPQQGPSASKVLATMAGVPVGGTLLTMSGLSLAASVIGLMIATPVFIIFSPVIVPAGFVVGLAVLGFLAANTMVISGMWLLSNLVSSVRRAIAGTEELDHFAKRRMAEMTGFVGQKTKEVGQKIESKAHDQAPGGQTGRT